MGYFPKPEHTKIMNSFFSLIDDESITSIADISVGRTSLFTLAKAFGFAKIDGFYYHVDDKFIPAIKEAIPESVDYKLFKMNICAQHITKAYDLAMGHLVVSRGLPYGQYYDLLQGIFSFNTRYLILIDDLDAINVNDVYNFAKKNGYILIKTLKERVSSYEDSYNFLKKNDIGFLFEKK